MKNLSTLNSGEIGVIVSINGDSRFLSRIISIGLTIGSEIEVIQNEKKRPILIYSRDTMIAINKKESQRIMLEVVRR